MAALDTYEPYRPPVAEPPVVARRPEYVSLQRRAARVGRLLVAFVVVAGINAAIDFVDGVTIATLGREGLELARAEAMDLRHTVVLLAYTVAFVAAAIPFGRLLVQANRNTVPLGRPAQRFSPAAMVWWFFVPIMGWIRPQQAVTEVWNAALPRPTTLTPRAVSSWWGLWIVGTIVGYAASRAADDVKTPAQLAGAYFMDLAVCVVMIAAAFAARKMLRELAELQDRAWIERGA